MEKFRLNLSFESSTQTNKAWCKTKREETNSRWQQQSYFPSIWNNFNIIHVRNDIVILLQLLPATKSSFREWEEIKSREFSDDAMGFTYRYASQIHHGLLLKDPWPRTQSLGRDCFGALCSKVIKTLHLYELVQVSLFLLTGGAQILKPTLVRLVFD